LAGGSNAPFYDGKGSTWEGGIRAPAIAWWPGKIAPGRVTQQVTTMMDIFPTIMQLVGIEKSNATLDGASLVPLLLGTNNSAPHTSIFIWREHTLMAVRQGAWKAHWVTRSGFGGDAPVIQNPPLLFNVEHDPGERYPVNVTTQPQVMAALTAAYRQHLKDVIPGTSQYDLGQDWSLIPCCKSTFDPKEWEYYIEHHEWSLALWELIGCVCPGESFEDPFQDIDLDERSLRW